MSSDPVSVDLRWEEIQDARRLSIAQKLTLGGDLFDSACEVALAAIRGQFPELTPDEALNVLRKRLATARLLETRL